MTEQDGRLIESFRKRRDEYRIPLRKESWEKLESELLSRSAFRRRMYRWMSVAAAILICLALSVPFFIHKKEIPCPENASPTQEQQQTIVAIATTPVSFSARKKTPSPAVEELLPAEEEIVPEEAAEETEKPETPSFTSPQQEKRTPVNYAPPATKKKQPSEWTFGLSAGSNNLKHSPSERIDEALGVNEPETVTPPYEDQGKETSIGSQQEINQYNYRHKLPISIGISVQKKLSGHFGLESGLTYTYLYSDVSEKSIPVHTGNQQLHYLGIPVKANWLLYNQKRFSIYLSGGALFEYCLSAGRTIGNREDELDFNHFQASFNAAAGMQLALTKPLSVFIEPGVSYFIDNGSSVETIRTDNPLMFNLQAGVRFTY